MLNTRWTHFQHTGCPICIWTILWGCLEVTGWLTIYFFISSKKFMQTPLKVNKVYFFDIKHGLYVCMYVLYFSDNWIYQIIYLWKILLADLLLLFLPRSCLVFVISGNRIMFWCLEAYIRLALFWGTYYKVQIYTIVLNIRWESIIYSS